MASKVQFGEVVVERHGDVAVLRLLGEHDISTVAAVRRAIATPVEAGEGVVVSLVETQFLDAAVVRALREADHELEPHGRRLVVHVATENVVRRVLEITGLTEDLPTTGSLHDALAGARQQKSGEKVG
jgi:anti-anti-sigma factor